MLFLPLYLLSEDGIVSMTVLSKFGTCVCVCKISVKIYVKEFIFDMVKDLHARNVQKTIAHPS